MVPGHFEQQAKSTRDVEHQLKCLLNTAQLRVLGWAGLTVDPQDVLFS